MYFGGEVDLGERGEKKLGGVKTGKKNVVGLYCMRKESFHLKQKDII